MGQWLHLPRPLPASDKPLNGDMMYPSKNQIEVPPTPPPHSLQIRFIVAFLFVFVPPSPPLD